MEPHLIHKYRIEKEENGVVFGTCTIHKDFAILIKEEGNEYYEVAYRGIDKKYTEDFYNKLLNHRKKQT